MATDIEFLECTEDDAGQGDITFATHTDCGVKLYRLTYSMGSRTISLRDEGKWEVVCEDEWFDETLDSILEGTGRNRVEFDFIMMWWARGYLKGVKARGAIS